MKGASEIMESFDACYELYSFLEKGGQIYLPPEIDRLSALKWVEQQVLPWTRIGFDPRYFMESDQPDLWPYIFISDNMLHMTSRLYNVEKVRDISIVMEMLSADDSAGSMPNTSEFIELLIDSEVFV